VEDAFYGLKRREDRVKNVVVAVSLLAMLLGLTTGFVAFAGSQAKAKEAGDELLGPRAAYDLIQKNKSNPDFVVLDVRTPDEFKDGHIEGAINVDYESGGFKTELRELDKKKTYFVYCRTGRRSGEAVKIMKDLGFNDIIRMKGDMVRWKSEGLPLVK
jgi:rhodanese-related sulfurtransferase